MTKWTTPHLRDHLLRGNVPDAALIDELVKQRLREDYYLDYKVGKWLTETKPQERVGRPTDPADRVRAWVTGFANGDGGVLIVGAANDEAAGGEVEAWSIQPCPPTMGKKGGKALKDWAWDVLAGHKHLLIPAPRIEVVEHPHGPILVIAVARAPNLIPVQDRGEWGHFLRFGDGTHWIPPYLHADLVLGRRQRPELRLELYHCQVAWTGAFAYDLTKRPPNSVTLKLKVRVHNDSIAWADDIRFGVVCFAVSVHGHHRSVPGSVLSMVSLAHLEDQIESQVWPHICPLTETRKPLLETQDIEPPTPIVDTSRDGAGPFEYRDGETELLARLPLVMGRFTWNAAIYVACRSMAPEWWQVTVAADGSGGVMKLLEHSAHRVVQGEAPVIDFAALPES